MEKEGYINKIQIEYLKTTPKPRDRIFYLLPKIHKPSNKWPNPNMPEGRPIVSDVNSESYNISEYIAHHLNKVANKHPSFLKNSYEFVDKIRDTPVQNNSFIVTADISSLYTNMHQDRCLEVVRKQFKQYPDPHRPDKHILDLLELTLQYNDFNFNGQYYLQTLGCAMGKRWAPALANLYLLEFDKQAMEGFYLKPKFYYRYLDDIFFIWDHPLETLTEYNNFLNNLIPDIKITMEIDLFCNNFLDVTIYKAINNNSHEITLQTKVFFKETDTHQLLHTTSHHPKHTCKGIIKSQLIRFKRISSTYFNYMTTAKTLFLYLRERGYGFSEYSKTTKDVWFNYKDKKDPSEWTIDEFFENWAKYKPLLPISAPFSKSSTKLLGDIIKTIKENKEFKDYHLVKAFTTTANLLKILVKSDIRKD